MSNHEPDPLSQPPAATILTEQQVAYYLSYDTPKLDKVQASHGAALRRIAELEAERDRLQARVRELEEAIVTAKERVALVVAELEVRGT